MQIHLTFLLFLLLFSSLSPGAYFSLKKVNHFDRYGKKNNFWDLWSFLLKVNKIFTTKAE